MNFEYVEQLHGMNSFARFCQEAETFVFSNPDISIGAARKSMEFVVKLLYGSAINQEISGLTLFDMLSDIDFIKYIDDRNLLDAIHYIRKNGNQAIHQGNMDSDLAIGVLERLHFVVGEVCVFLDLVGNYPQFQNPTDKHKAVYRSTLEGDEPKLDPAIISFFSPRLHSIRSYSEHNKIIDVHVDPRESASIAKKTVIVKNVDSAANVRTAFQVAADWLAKKLVGAKVAADYSKLVFSFVMNNNTVTIAVRTGCSILGYKGIQGEWELLPGLCYILYAPDISGSEPILKQLRVFTRDEFLEMWKSLDLIRYKVSNAATKRYKQLLGDDIRISVDQYADIASVQSFMNSGKKSKAVFNYYSKFPVLESKGLDKILK